jgi:hypothetical protein
VDALTDVALERYVLDFESMDQLQAAAFSAAGSNQESFGQYAMVTRPAAG